MSPFLPSFDYIFGRRPEQGARAWVCDVYSNRVCGLPSPHRLHPGNTPVCRQQKR